MDRMGVEGEEEEEDEDVDQGEVQRRKERLEREQWLREQVCKFKSIESCTQIWEEPWI